MKPDLKNIFQKRFHGHEADVDPGVWEAIRTQITTAAPAADPLEDLFRERFQQHEVNVDPSVWNSISAQIGYGATVGATATGVSYLGWFAAASTAIVLSVGVYLYSNSDGATELARQEVILPIKEKDDLETSATESNFVDPSVADITTEQIIAGPERTEIASVEREVALERATSKAAGSTDPIDRNSEEQVAIGTDQPESRSAGVGTGSTETGSTTTNEQGRAVVNSIIDQLAQEVHIGTVTAEKHDPVVPATAVVVDQGIPGQDPKPTKADLPEIFLPNTFTPNGDGINDTYKVDKTGFTSMMIRIYSLQDNKLVFSTDNNAEWDGAHAEKGYYLVAIEAMTEDGRLLTKGKAVWLNNDRY